MGLFEALQVSTGLFQGLATVLVAIILHRQSEKFKRIELQTHAINAYNVLNSAALSSSENLHAFDTLGRADANDTDESRRRRWCAFMWLEALQMTFLAMQHGLIEEAYGNQAL